MVALVIDTPRKLAPLLQPARYKGAYGGRGGAKSHFFAEQIVIRCYSKTTRVACIREVQTTIKDSVRQLLINKIAKFGLIWAFDVFENEIRGKAETPAAGSLIIFRGMQSYNAENIKSLEDFDIAWVEEAQTFSAHSLKMLRPTIRKDGSELWFSWNPRHDTDAVDQFFRGGNQRTGMICVNVNWYDNPWFPEVLKTEKDEDYENDPEVAENVWGGGYELITEGSYYGKHIAKAEREGRIGFFPHNPDLPVITSWDIGVDDYTAIWFWQEDGETVTAIDYFEVSGDGAEEIVKAALPELNPDREAGVAALVDADRDVAFKYLKHHLPHDVMNREWGAGARSRYQTLTALGVKPIKVGVAQGPEERVNALRALFPAMHFHSSPRVQLGLKRLRRYSRKRNDALNTYTTPLHDENSHGADAAGEFAVNCSIRPKPEPKAPPKHTNTFEAKPDGTITSNLDVKQAIDAMIAKRRARDRR
jgi:phage terminase large subunit